MTAARHCGLQSTTSQLKQQLKTLAALTGEKYVKQEVRKGILPSILAALMNARAATRAALKEVPPDQPSQRAVLDSRQKALKLTANALYGFTGRRGIPAAVCTAGRFLPCNGLSGGYRMPNTLLQKHRFLSKHLQVIL